MTTDLGALFGSIDVYLFDQLLRGRISPGMRVLDAGCGRGRNLVFFFREGYEVRALDPDPAAVEATRSLARRLAPAIAETNVRREPVEDSTFPEACADVVISSAVLHFAPDEVRFLAMLRGTWRLLAPGGLLFCRLASSIGIEGLVRPLGGRRFALPDGTDRFLVDEAFLLEWSTELGGRLLDPLKTTVVQGQRAMTTWVVRKEG
ncbi:MAG: class I SAM-dependent methyltransferase [Thermoanaerobaculia bacterium]